MKQPLLAAAITDRRSFEAVLKILAAQGYTGRVYVKPKIIQACIFMRKLEVDWDLGIFAYKYKGITIVSDVLNL